MLLTHSLYENFRDYAKFVMMHVDYCHMCTG